MPVSDSMPDDVQILHRALTTLHNPTQSYTTLHLSNCGTAMRFLTAYCAQLEGQTTIMDGVERMQETVRFSRELRSIRAYTDIKQAQLGEAVALSVLPQTVLGLTRADWNGVFWAGVLMLLTLICLYAAVKKEKCEEDYCFD